VPAPRDLKAEAGGRARSTEATAKSEARKVAVNPALELAARAGWAVKGLLYLTMGVLALGVALGRSGATDQRGSLKLLTGLGPWGTAVLIAVVVGLAGYALWSFLGAVLDPLGEGGERSLGRRLSALGGGIAYTGLLLFCLQLLFGRGGGTSDSTLPGAVATLLDRPFGPWLAGAAGLAGIGAGVVQLVQAARSSFQKDLDRAEMSEEERRVAVTLGRFGSAARGGVFMVIGWFVLQAAVLRDPHQAKGMGGALGALAQQPAGRVLLVALALGFVALALYSFAAARWMRVPGAAPRR
jgi:Domain of Unknown Function (DUF1206)